MAQKSLLKIAKMILIHKAIIKNFECLTLTY